MKEMVNLLWVENLKKHFKTSYGIVKAVDGIDFTIKSGEIFGLVGESGSGKSTAGHVIVGIYTPTVGRILFKDQDISVPAIKRPKRLKREIQMVFQDPASSLNPKKTIKDIVGLPLKVHGLVNSKEELEEKAAKALEMVELPPEELMYRHPADLGGGEKQAVSIARAISTNPSFVILDEPTSALDVSIQAKIIKALMKIQKDLNLSYLFITHDLSLMRNVASMVAIMYLGKIYEQAPTGMFFYNPLHPYTKMLLSSIPVLTDEENKMKPKKVAPKGEIPSAVNIPPGCRFHTRCPFTMDICKVKEPNFVMVEPGHHVACHLYNQK
ncbi:MAG TPA: ABC transporter ATP-binding protein [Thermoplasmata archaeon]|nr:ABC transporter ATP-binding protein [Thermoplasmata archaeon]